MYKKKYPNSFRAFLLCPIFFLFFSGFITTYATTIIVTNTNDSGEGSFRAAISLATFNDTIRFDAGLADKSIVLSTGELLINRSVTIDGTDAPNLVLDGNNGSRIMRLGWEFDASVGANVPITVNIKNLSFVNGVALNTEDTDESYQLEGAGGAIFVLGVGNTINVENCMFNNNTSHGWGGGAVYIGNAGTSSFMNCKFENNRTNTDDDTQNGDKGEKGGTLSQAGDGSLTVKNCEFRNNLGVNGAGISVADVNLLVENSIFENNDTHTIPKTFPSPANMPPTRAYGYGAAIYTDGANRNEQEKFQTVKGCRFVNNVGHGQGGAVFLFGYSGDVLTVEGCTFSGNEVVTEAYTGSSFSMGGGLRIGGGGLGSRTDASLSPLNVNIRNSTFDNNLAYNQGGGIWVQLTDGGDAILENCTVYKNRSYFDGATQDSPRGNGGGVNLSIINGSKATLRNMTIANNTVSWQGAGINLSSISAGTAENTTITNSIVAYNKAENGGNTWNIKHNINSQAGDGDNNIQSNELETSERFLDLLTETTLVIDPMLNPLANNGGSTKTMALKEGSPAIDAGSGCVSTDQLGRTRKGSCDIGAVEYGISAITSIEEDINKNLGIELYPNPSKDYIMLSSDFIIKGMQIYNLEGKLLKQQQLNSRRAKIDISVLPNGVYFLMTSEGARLKFLK